MIKNILFDLDGTLWPVDMRVFLNTYMGYLADAMTIYGFDKKGLIDSVWKGTYAMVGNDGSMTNEERFWEVFFKIYPDIDRNMTDKFIDFYRSDFDKVKTIAEPYAGMREWFDLLKDKGYRLVLASNPFFPSIATEKRVKWSGLDKDDFEYITTYENSSYCKPNLDYYRELLNKLNMDPCESLMIGNDVDEDMIAEELGMRVFLLTDNILNPHNKDISKYPQGGFEELKKFVEECA